MFEAVGRVGRERALKPVALSRSEPRAAQSEPRVEPVAAVHGIRLDRRSDFLAHLIAERDDFAQARARRRAEPSVAAAAYRKAASLVEDEPGRERAKA